MSASRALERLWAAQESRLALWAPALFACGAASALDGPSLGAPLVLATACLGVAALAAAFRFGLAARVLGAICACFLLGAAAGAARLALVEAPVIGAEIETALEGRVRKLDASVSGRARLTLDALDIAALAPSATPDRVRVTLFSGDSDVSPGDRVALRARLAPPAGPVEPGAFDFSRAAWFDRLGGIGIARSVPMQVAPRAAPGPSIWIDRQRARLASVLRARLPGEAGALAAAIAVGDRSGLTPEALEALRRGNLSHLLSISGLHMAIVAGLAYAGARLLLALTPGAALWWRIKKLSALIGIAAGLGYLALSGASTPTQRAFVMAMAAFSAVLLDRPGATIRALAFAALCVLAIAPESLFEVGFQLSFAAALALVTAFEEARRRGWTDPAPGWRAGLRRWAAALIASSLVAGLATAPIAGFHFNRLAPWGFPANLAAVPVMSLVVAPALAAAALAAPFGLSQPPLWVAGRGLDWIMTVARAAAEAPGAARGLPAAPQAVLFAYGLGLLWLCLWAGRWRWLGVAGLAMAGALWASASRPTLLIAPHGAATGALTEGARAAEGARRANFIIGQWLRRDGDLADAAIARKRSGYQAQQHGWISADLANGWTLQINRQRILRDADARCVDKTILLVPHLWRGPHGPCLTLDGAALNEAGAMAIWINHAGAEVRRAQ